MLSSSLSSSSMVESENFEKLFDITLQGKWGEVVKIYEHDPSTHKARITQTGGTALHAAVIQGQKEIVSKLVEVILKEDREALRVQNDAGYTALHHAASMGSVCMCKCIAKDYPQLIGDKTKSLSIDVILMTKEAEMIQLSCMLQSKRVLW
ncbi:hypothetical protein FEM48_ZijujUnG0028400 [Ziziphus jujuba var. spinosa]|uniref:Uncharacterized protein n=1 Tax=Ziziphus jujuba var. spinosa TaxID=714518 RepID=A0A978U9L2_ZIZJJ|nr:hypothetical protein FEM48_ZijujUnG0028400 [Ziziphus jujuba var. spinosa]